MKTNQASRKGIRQKSVQLPVLGDSQPISGQIRKSRMSRRRAGVLIAVNLLMIAHFAQWWYMGRTISPIEPSETMFTLQRGAINFGFIFFSLAILATLIFGRFVCGWGCHIVALQDFCAWLLKKIGLTPRPFRSRLLIYVPLLAALHMFVWPTLARGLWNPTQEPIIPAFTNHLITNNFWETFPTIAVAIPFLFVCGFMTVYFLGSKGFCTYACPYGGFFRLAEKISPARIRVTDACKECGHCTVACTSNVLVHAEVKQFGMVVDPGCMKCMDCVSVCPNDALYFGFGKPPIAISPSLSVRKSYSLTWPEEIAGGIIFLASFLAVWDVYLIVPELMALGYATVTTFLSLTTWRLLRARHLSFYNGFLKTGGRIQSWGWAFAAFALVWIGLNIHSGWIRYHEYEANLAFQRIQIPDELALAQVNPRSWFGADDQQNIMDGKEHLETATKFGLFTNSDALAKLGWFDYLSGDAERSVLALAIATTHQQGQAKALSQYYRGAILNRLRRHDEALKSLDQALAEREDLILAREEKGESLWQMGRRDEAVAVWTDAVHRNPRLVLALNQLAGAKAAFGKFEEANADEKVANDFTPNNPLYHWMIGLRLRGLGMNDLAERHFQQAMQLDPAFKTRSKG